MNETRTKVQKQVDWIFDYFGEDKAMTTVRSILHCSGKNEKTKKEYWRKVKTEIESRMDG